MTAETQVFAQTEELATEYEYDEHMYGEERIEFELRELGRLIDAFEQAQPQQAEFLGFGRSLQLLPEAEAGHVERPASVASVSSGSSTAGSDGTSSEAMVGTCRSRTGSDGTSSEAMVGPRGGALKLPWTPEEDKLIAEGVALFGHKWSRIRKLLPGTSDARTDDAVRNRWQRLQRKQTRTVAKAARAGRACDAAALVPGKDKAGDMWTPQEDETIEEGVILHGLLFRAIAATLSGRTESGCRNRWLRNQQRRLLARGVRARGAQEVFAALHASGELSESGVYRPLLPEQHLDEWAYAPSLAGARRAPAATALPPPPPASLAGEELALAPAPCDYPWEMSGAIQALRASACSAVAAP